MAVLILLKCWTTRGNHATSSATIHPFCNDSSLYHILCLCFCSGLFHYYSQYIKTQVVPSVCADLNVNNRLVFTSRGCLLRQAWNRKYLNRSKWIKLNSIFKFNIQTRRTDKNLKWELFHILFVSPRQHWDGMESKRGLIRRVSASQMFLVWKIPASPFSLNPNLNISHRVVISSSVKYLTVWQLFLCLWRNVRRNFWDKVLNKINKTLGFLRFH